MFHVQYSLTNPLPELPKFLNSGRELRRRPTAHQSRTFAFVDETRGAEPARESAAIWQHLHGFVRHYGTSVDEVKEQVIADRQESVAPIVVHVPTSFNAPKSPLTKMIITVNESCYRLASSQGTCKQ